MAEVLDQHNFSARHGNAKYPWDVWGDGQIRKITRGTDFDVTPRVIQGQIKVRGKKENRQTVTTVQGDSVVFAFRNADESCVEFKARTRS